MKNHFIDNFKFMEAVSEMADRVVEEKLKEEGYIKITTGISYSEEGLDLFMEVYDDFESILNVVGIYSDNDIEEITRLER